MSQTTNQQPPDGGSTGNTNRRRPRLFLGAFLIIIGCIFPPVLYMLKLLALIPLGIFLSLIAIVVTIIQPIFDDVAYLFVSIWNKIGRFGAKISRKQAKSKLFFLIDYVISDYRWAKWLEKQFVDVGFSNKIELREWDTSQNNSKDFKAEMKEASNDAEYVIMIVSKTYLENVYSSKKGLATFKSLIESGSTIFANVIDKDKLDEFLNSLPRINLMGADIDESQARSQFRRGLPAKVKKQFVQPVASSAKNEDDIHFPGGFPHEWNIPAATSLFFTRDEKILKELHDLLQFREPQALSGLEEIGTTEIAIEYANRYHREYRYGLWIQMTPYEEYERNLHEIGDLLKIQKGSATIPDLQQDLINWLSNNDGWILILNGCESKITAGMFLPRRRRGHILLTTSESNLENGINTVPIGGMKEEEGALFLLLHNRRFERADDSDKKYALKISKEMGGFPKALYQVALLTYRDYGEIATLKKFYNGYVNNHDHFLKLYRHKIGAEVYAWYGTYKKFRMDNPLAADLLRFYAFLSCAAIPEAIIKSATIRCSSLSANAGDDLILQKNLMDLRDRCLIELDPDGSVQMNRLVQRVLRDELDAATKKSYAEQSVLTVNDVFPDPNPTNSPEISQYISHAIVCAEFIQEYQIASTEAELLLVKIAEYKYGQGHIEEARKYFRRGEEIHGIIQKAGQKL